MQFTIKTQAYKQYFKIDKYLPNTILEKKHHRADINISKPITIDFSLPEEEII